MNCQNLTVGRKYLRSTYQPNDTSDSVFESAAAGDEGGDEE
jgi:hypothetical protein